MKLFRITFKMYVLPMYKTKIVCCSSESKLRHQYEQFSMVASIQEIEMTELKIIE